MNRVLFDTSCWIQHFRSGYQPLIEALEDGSLIMHAWVIGELACGNLTKRQAIIKDLIGLPKLDEASFKEVTSFIENHSLYGKGLGWVDLQLLAACIAGKADLATLDRRLAKAYQKIA